MLSETTEKESALELCEIQEEGRENYLLVLFVWYKMPRKLEIRLPEW